MEAHSGQICASQTPTTTIPAIAVPIQTNASYICMDPLAGLKAQVCQLSADQSLMCHSAEILIRFECVKTSKGSLQLQYTSDFLHVLADFQMYCCILWRA